MRLIKRFQKILLDVDSRDIFIQGFSFLSIRIVGIFVGYLFTYFIATQYGAAVNGLVSLAFTLFLFLSIFSRLGIDINLIRFYAIEDNFTKSKGLFTRVLLKSVLFSSILSFLLYLAKDFIVFELFKKPQFEPYIIWTALAIPFWVITSLCAGYLRAREQNKWFAFLNNPGRFLFALLFFLFLWLIHDQPLNAIIAHFYGVVVLAILSLIVAYSNIKTISLKTEESSWLFLKEAFPMMLSSTILILLGWLDTFVLGIFESNDNIGIYNVAIKIATFTSFTLQAINSILAPKLAKSHNEQDQALFNKLIRFTTTLNFYSTLIIVALIVLTHKWLLGIFGDEFVSGGSVLILLCLGQLINSMSGSVGVILQMTGKQKVYQYIVIVALFLNIILNFTLIPKFGIVGAAIATVVSISSWNVIGAVYLKRKMNIRSYYYPF